MATINGVEVVGDKTAHDFDLLDKNDGINLANDVERNREATEDNHQDIVLHRTDTDVHVTPEWKNSLVSKETLGLYWTAAQTADIINEISIAGGAKLVKVDELPETGQEQTIYLVPKSDPLERDIFDEFVWIDGKFEFIGTTKADLSGYFPITGGALTGNIIERNTDSDHLGISGAYWGHGAYLWLSGQNSGYAGAWYLSARDTEKSCDLIGSPSGVLSWGGKLVATEDDLANYLPLKGGTMIGNLEYYSTSDGFKPGFEWFQNNERFAYVHTYTDEAYSDKSLLIQADTNIKLYSNNLEFNGKSVDTIEEQGDGYIRYSNGLQICTGTSSAITLLPDEVKIASATFPKSFSSAPDVIVCSVNPHIIASTWEISTTGCEVYLKSTSPGTGTNYGRYIAFGKWK